jgi:uncharacterized protein (DUF1684 family)
MLVLALAPAPLDYIAEQRAWRNAQEVRLKNEGGWLSVAGLYWLKPGQNRIGSGLGNDFVLPKGQSPDFLGTATLAAGKVVVRFTEGTEGLVNGHRVRAAELRSDAEGAPDRLQVGRLNLTVIQRGKRIGFRVVDPEAPRRKAFKGLRWFPIDPKYRVVARFVPYKTPKNLQILNVLGDTRNANCPGYALFRLNGKTVRLDAEDAGDGLFFNFRDRTCGTLTYPAGRFLDAPKPKNGTVILDFNRATNPPCAFTDFATCPLPPRQNDLPVAVRAGALDGHSDR